MSRFSKISAEFEVDLAGAAIGLPSTVAALTQVACYFKIREFGSSRRISLSNRRALRGTWPYMV